MFDALPEAFGSYRVLEAIGDGRFGPVYRAREDATGLFVAIKVFDQGLTTDQAARLVATLGNLRNTPLNHPSIVPILSAAAERELVWVAEPWFDAIALDVVMRRDGAQPFADVLLRITQIAGALDFAAAVGIHHGALHPHDILVAGDQTAVVGIGVLQALSDAGLAVPMEGAYVSPQRAHGLPASAADDIFSLAAITYELVQGTPVPPRSELRAAAARPAGIDHARFAGVVERAMSPEPEDRPQKALRFAEEVQAAIIPIPIQHSDSAIPIQHSDSAIPIRHSDSAIPIQHSDAVIPIHHSDSIIPIRDSGPAIPIRDSDAAAAVLTSEPASRSPEPRSDSVADLPLRADQVEFRSESRNQNQHWEQNQRNQNQRNQNQHRNQKAESESESESSNRNPESESASGYWFPVSATLAIGLLMGFASGYVVGQRDGTPTPHATERPVARSESTAPADPPRSGSPAPNAGRDFTESVVPQPVPPRDASQPTERTTGATRTTGTERPERPEPGVLQVDSRPRGARVFIDGRLVGTTPVVVADVRPGAHAVRIDLIGHRRWVTSVDVVSGQRQRVAASLER